MKTETFHFELLTPTFCGGADPKDHAEIRAPSIRGQLRWWFRTLGGFKSLESRRVRDQEAEIFGCAAGDKGKAGKLTIRVSPCDRQHMRKVSRPYDPPAMNTPEGYLLFPLRQQSRHYLITSEFKLTVIWRGPDQTWDDICALIWLYGHLGSLGFRSRRAMGALAIKGCSMSLGDALKRFTNPENITIKALNHSCKTQNDCIKHLGEWLKSWREHGRTPHLAVNQPGFDWARRDHNEGFRVLTGSRVTSNPPGHVPKGNDGDTFRSALGLPIVQFFSSRPRGTPNKVFWMPEFDQQKAEQNREYKGEGRFASPILLRPYRAPDGSWHPLVIFVDKHKWKDGKCVYLNGQMRRVSLELYNKMREHPALKDYI